MNSTISSVDLSRYQGLALDSRKVEPGFLFGAFPGEKTDGRNFIDKAIDAGAVGILTLEGTEKPVCVDEAGAAWLTFENPRQIFAQLAGAFYAPQPKHVVGVTGTNGKTSVANFVQQIWQALGTRSASLGTLGLHGDESLVEIAKGLAALTTPDAAGLQSVLAAVKAVGVDYVAMEASSHGLDQYRLDGTRFAAAAFTNLSQDHLDYHKTIDAYFSAKTRLFSELVLDGGAAVLNADIAEFETLNDLCDKRGLRVMSYGENGQDFTLKAIAPGVHGLAVDVEIFGRAYSFVLNLAGSFQAYNVLAALGLVVSEHPQDAAFIEAVIRVLPGLKGAPGRLDYIEGHPENAGVYVDYAHTPDALVTVLKAMRPHVSGRLVCVFGCGGERDNAKRPLMGQAVAEHADIGILTDDNPRSEDPASIRAQARKGQEDVLQEIAGRDKAIAHAIGLLKDGDVLVIAGKGHEQGQDIGGKVYPFCDRAQARAKIQKLL